MSCQCMSIIRPGIRRAVNPDICRGTKQNVDVENSASMETWHGGGGPLLISSTLRVEFPEGTYDMTWLGSKTRV